MGRTRTIASLLFVLLALTPVAGFAAAPAAPASARKSAAVGTNEARIGGRGFGRTGRPTFGTRRPSARRPTIRRPLRRRPLFRHGFFGSILRALGIAYLVHLLFGWGAGGGSPLGLLFVIGIVSWLVTRRRRRRTV